MFFGKQSSSATSGKSAPQQDAPRPSSPVVISPASSLAPSVATLTVPILPAKAGLFSKWQRSSGSSFTSSASFNDQAIISELRKKNVILVDYNDGLMQAYQLNQLTVQKLATDCEAKDKECAQLRVSSNSLTTQLELLKQEVHDQTAALQAEVQILTTSCDELVQERDSLVNNASTLNAQQASLQQEKNALADKVKKYELGTNLLTQQITAYAQISTQQQQSSKDQVDAMYAQQLRAEQRTSEQLKGKDALIRELQAQLKQCEVAANKVIVSREDEIATLSIQLKHSDMERETLAQHANEWQDCSNGHLARVHELEERVKQLTARSP